MIRFLLLLFAMGNALSRATEIDSAIKCNGHGCGYVAQNEAELVKHNRTVHHAHHGSQRKPRDRRFSVNRNQQTGEFELTVRGTEVATGRTVYIPYTTDDREPTPEPNQQLSEQQHHLQQWLLDHISTTVTDLGPTDEQTALGLADFMTDLLEKGETAGFASPSQLLLLCNTCTQLTCCLSSDCHRCV